MPLGIRLQFYRQRSHQFRAKTSHSPSVQDEQDFKEAFNVCGANDFCVVKPFECLSDLVAGPKDDQLAMLFGGRSDIILLPGQMSESTNDASADWHRKLSNSQGSGKSVKLLFILRINVASPLIDLAKTFQDVLITIESTASFAANVLSKKCRDIEWSTWTTLGGGSDVIVLAIPRPDVPKDLQNLNSAIACFRACPVSKIDGRGGLPTSHAFSSVQASLCFRDQDYLIDALPKTSRTRSAKNSLKILTRVTTAVGHEKTFLTNSKLPRINESLQTWGHRSLYIQFDSLRDYLLAVTNAAWDEQTRFLWKHDIDGLRTTISFGTPTEGLSHKPAWKIDDDFDANLSDARTSIARFAVEFLGANQARDLIQFVDAVISAFRKSDRAGSVRDLLPFLFRLAELLKDISNWRKFFLSDKEDGIFQEYSGEFDRLIGHAWRALRNRVEYRGEPIDPSFPSTLEHGASKLVNAYAVSAWLCWEVLRSPNDNDHKERCASEEFAACVAAGVKGSVWCESLFGRFHEKYASTLPPLTILSISGKLLFEPEIAFSCCLHEMAEFGSWITIDHNQGIRAAINNWIFDAYVRVTISYFRQWYDNLPRNKKTLKPDDTSQLIKILGDSFRSNIEEVEFSNAHPERFLETLHQEFFKYLTSAQLGAQKHRGITEQFGKFVGYCNNHLFDREPNNGLTSWVKETTSLLREVIPDIAMVTALWTTLRLSSSKAKLALIDRLFEANIDATRDWYPENSGYKTGVMHSVLRWAIQVAATSGDAKWLSKSKLHGAWNKYWPANGECTSLSDLVANHPDLFPSHDGHCIFTPEFAFVSVLQRFVNYNESAPNSANSLIKFWHPSSDCTAGKLLAAFADLWNSEKAQGLEQLRVDFVLSLWAKAQLLCVDKIFSSLP